MLQGGVSASGRPAGIPARDQDCDGPGHADRQAHPGMAGPKSLRNTPSANAAIAASRPARSPGTARMAPSTARAGRILTRATSSEGSQSGPLPGKMGQRAPLPVRGVGVDRGNPTC
jgi:hypothetical protein